jgi:hypothetical protein
LAALAEEIYFLVLTAWLLYFRAYYKHYGTGTGTRTNSKCLLAAFIYKNMYKDQA